MKYLLLGLIVLLAGLILLREHLLSKEVKEKPVVFKETPLPLPIRDTIDTNKWVGKSISLTTTVGPPTKWNDAIGIGTVERVDIPYLLNEITKLRKELLAAIEKNKCKHEIIIIEQPDEGMRNMPYYPDRTDPRFDTNAYKILLHSEN